MESRFLGLIIGFVVVYLILFGFVIPSLINSDELPVWVIAPSIALIIYCFILGGVGLIKIGEKKKRKKK